MLKSRVATDSYLYVVRSRLKSDLVRMTRCVSGVGLWPNPLPRYFGLCYLMLWEFASPFTYPLLFAIMTEYFQEVLSLGFANYDMNLRLMIID